MLNGCCCKGWYIKRGDCYVKGTRMATGVQRDDAITVLSLATRLLSISCSFLLFLLFSLFSLISFLPSPSYPFFLLLFPFPYFLFYSCRRPKRSVATTRVPVAATGNTKNATVSPNKPVPHAHFFFSLCNVLLFPLLSVPFWLWAYP